ncbi:4-hydroxyphenylacetate 3-hydroxylase family protein [Stappia sp.]|uniref:4-hydroxyphenylacetate 3-hydroxylase family protein n=1 Tax=Stappia sp. TaxID=1870903 RepID=UPI003A9A1D3E
MAFIKNGADHIESLRDGRAVYIDGERVADVTTHPAFRNSVRSAAALYDFQASPENVQAMTFDPDGTGERRVNRAWSIPRSHEEMIERRQALTAWAELSFGYMGRSPDHLASALLGQRIGLDVFAQGGEARARAFKDYYDYITREDHYLSYVIINPQADRSKDWGEQAADLVARVVDEDGEGLTIRGAKMMGTSTVMANEIFVANLQPLRPGEENLAFCCALPMNARGLKVLSRKSYEAASPSKFDNPLSSSFDENDALVYFDDVKVPWDRVFVHGDVNLARAHFHDTPGHVYQNYQAQIRLVTKLKFLLGIARKVTETIGTTRIPPVTEKLGILAARVGMVEAALFGMEASGHLVNGYWVPNRHQLYAAQCVTQALYPEFVAAIRDLAGGALIMLPSSARDFANPEIRAIIEKTQISGAYEPEGKVKLLKAAWDAIGSEFGSRHIQYEMFYAGAQFVTAGHSFRTYDWKQSESLVDTLLDSYALDTALPAPHAQAV